MKLGQFKLFFLFKLVEEKKNSSKSFGSERFLSCDKYQNSSALER